MVPTFIYFIYVDIVLKIDTICSEDAFLIEGTIGPDGIQSHNRDLTQKKTRSYPDIKKVNTASSRELFLI